MSDYDSAAWLALQHRIEVLEEAQVNQVMDLVKALSDLSAALRREGQTEHGMADDYAIGFRDGYYSAAVRIDALSTGPVMQQALDAVDARIPE